MSARPAPRRGGAAGRRRWAWVPAGALLLLVVEVWLLVQLAHLAGGGWVLALLLVETAAGALVLRRAGREALEALRQGPAGPFGGSVPARRPGAVGNAVLVGLGGALLVLPGPISDVVGLLCLFPPTRRLLRRSFARLVRHRVEGLVRAGGGRVVTGDVVTGDDVVDGEVVDGEVVEDPRALGR
ncbi:UPF0716 protein FxsA [Kineococcus radiotolerans]|uniref:UPF0716 protein FxsA n=1 Tax=Kineococcus radiotolerans TaxID=131568 RepID=A0A7W4TIG6_KINRA|nr:FxsA family protein [Kineococcus radiotolerans]MBB2899504.1 UPF0716 protein FxsA [Kineococcus radiotolerans]